MWRRRKDRQINENLAGRRWDDQIIVLEKKGRTKREAWGICKIPMKLRRVMLLGRSEIRIGLFYLYASFYVEDEVSASFDMMLLISQMGVCNRLHSVMKKRSLQRQWRAQQQDTENEHHIGITIDPAMALS